MDGNFDDWKSIPADYADPEGDGKFNGIDIRDIKIRDDKDNLYIYVEVTREISIQNDNNLTLLIDTDNNLQTGKKINGIGCDLRWDFGRRSGTLYSSSGSPFSISHGRIGMITAPTVTSDRIEIRLDKRSTHLGKRIFGSKDISIRIEDNSSSGDDAPDDIKGINYTMTDTDRTYEYTTSKVSDEDIRIVSLNSERDQLFKPGADAPNRRLFSSLRPDIIAFQELYDHSASQVKNKIQSYTSDSYFAEKVGSDLVLLSKYPILQSRNIGGNAVHIIQLPSKKIVLSNNHFYCCANDDGRQEEADILMKTIRDIRRGTSTFSVDQDIPVVILGDLNLVGKQETLTTLLEGKIKNNSSFGPDFNPDYDGSPFASSTTYTLGSSSNYTWYKPNENYSAGKLDYIIYSDFAIDVRQSYNIDTRILPQDVLNSLGLKKDDSALISDHLPMVFDIASVSLSTEDIVDNHRIAPNPHNGIFQIDESQDKTIRIYNLNGEQIPFSIYGSNVHMHNTAPGIYILEIQGQNHFVTHKMLVH